MQLQRAKIIATSLMREHKLYIWNFSFDNAVRRLGLCDSGKNLITVSKFFTHLNPESVIRDVILHEIAHAIDKCVNSHNKIWKKIFCDIGGSGLVSYSSEAAAQPPHKYRGVCAGSKYWSGCRHTFLASRRFNFCTNCPKVFPSQKNVRSQIIWTNNEPWDALKGEIEGKCYVAVA